MYGDGSCQWRNPDLMGNVYDSPDRTDRSYGRGGQLRENRKWRYYYDSHGNLVLKTMRRSGPSLETGMRDEFLLGRAVTMPIRGRAMVCLGV